MVERAGAEARLGFKVHSTHAQARLWLRVSQQGHDTHTFQAYLGYRSIQHTVRYTELSARRFKDFWRW